MKALLLSLLLLTGCSTVVPVVHPWPQAPGMQSMQGCPELQKLEPDATLSAVAKTVTLNYSEYYTCLVKLEAWQEWYRTQKIIHENFK